MIQVKATCNACGGTGYNSDHDAASALFCPDCDGKGVLILTSEKWDIELEQVPNSVAYKKHIEEVGAVI